MGTAADVVEVGVVDDDADGEVGVVVVGEDPRGAFGRPFPWASASPGSARPTKRNRPIAEGRVRRLTPASRYFAAGASITGAGTGAVRTCFAAWPRLRPSTVIASLS